VLGCAIIYILLIIEHDGYVTPEKPRLLVTRSHLQRDVAPFKLIHILKGFHALENLKSTCLR